MGNSVHPSARKRQLVAHLGINRGDKKSKTPLENGLLNSVVLVQASNFTLQTFLFDSGGSINDWSYLLFFELIDW